MLEHWLPSLTLLDLAWLAFAVFLSGLARGFAGFGTALVYVPLAGLVLPPVWVIMSILVFDLIGPLPLVPESLRNARRGDLIMLALGLCVGVPTGVWLLADVDPTAFRWGTSILALLLLAVLVSGWRYAHYLRRSGVLGVGALGGFLGGLAGVPGPPVILLYMSGPGRAAEVRATMNLYLLIFEAILIVVFAAFAMLAFEPLLIGVLLIAPYMLACWIGAKLFDPNRERLFRRVAYALIAGAALYGIPWHG
ncbi:MAG: sulfite exporter TauE/SafE family protein [Pseudomonadota bacterium]